MRVDQKQRDDLRHDGKSWRYWPPGSNEPVGPSFSTLLELLNWKELPRRRSQSDLATLGITPDLTLQPNNGTGLYLPNVKTIVYTTPWAIDRQWRVAEILTALGFTNWAFFYGQKSQPYWWNIAKDHAKLVAENPPPLLILEDDIEVRSFRANLKIPTETDIAYLGGGRSGDKIGRVLTRLNHPQAITRYGYCYWDLSQDWFRIGGMWFSHAILYLEEKAMTSIASEWLKSPHSIDTTLARNQWRWNCQCLKTPLFWQNDHHHFHDTYDYAPQTG